MMMIVILILIMIMIIITTIIKFSRHYIHLTTIIIDTYLYMVVAT